MNERESDSAWKLFHLNWAVIGAMAAVLATAMLAGGFSVKPSSLTLPLVTIAVYVGAAYYNVWRGKRDPLVIFILGSTGQILSIALVMTPITYVAASLAFPLQDHLFAAVDRAMGLDWNAHFDFIAQYDWLVTSAVSAYSMIRLPVFAIPVVLGFVRHYRRLQEFTLALALTLIVTTVISTALPAVGVYDEQMFTRANPVFSSPAYLLHLHDFGMLRAGTMHEFDLDKLAGILTFPSFHAAAAILYLWALWSVWWMRPVALAVNAAMIAATPIIGGHYFIDVIAGMALAVAAIAAAKWISRRYLARAAEPAASLAPASAPAE